MKLSSDYNQFDFFLFYVIKYVQCTGKMQTLVYNCLVKNQLYPGKQG